VTAAVAVRRLFGVGALNSSIEYKTGNHRNKMPFIQQRQKLRTGWNCVGELELMFLGTQRYGRIE